MRRINDLAENIVMACMAECRGHHEASNRNFVALGHRHVALSCLCVHVGVIDYRIGFSLQNKLEISFKNEF